MKTLGAIPSNQKDILQRGGAYSMKQKARCFGQDIMRGENKNFRKCADKSSNLNKAPKKPDWASGTGTENMAPGTSIFDPVLCEIIYKWFCPPNGYILDPFAGGSVRGIVAGYLGYRYTGIDLSRKQIKANIEQLKHIEVKIKPRWIVGDSSKIDRLVIPRFDLIFSCPPYYDLERYSSDEKDISAMPTYEKFLETYKIIINKTVSLLKDNRFACFVVGDIRDKKGIYRNFVSDTIKAFIDAGAFLYNEAILATSLGSLPIRISKQFISSRKLGKTHQNVLIFIKGNPKEASRNCGNIDIDNLINNMETVKE